MLRLDQLLQNNIGISRALQYHGHYVPRQTTRLSSLCAKERQNCNHCARADLIAEEVLLQRLYHAPARRAELGHNTPHVDRGCGRGRIAGSHCVSQAAQRNVHHTERTRASNAWR